MICQIHENESSTILETLAAKISPSLTTGGARCLLVGTVEGENAIKEVQMNIFSGGTGGASLGGHVSFSGHNRFN